MIIASDGLWDAFSNEEAVNYIKDRLDEPHFGAKSIVLQAYYRGSLDNVTVMIVNFMSNEIAEACTEELEASASVEELMTNAEEVEIQEANYAEAVVNNDSVAPVVPVSASVPSDDVTPTSNEGTSSHEGTASFSLSDVRVSPSGECASVLLASSLPTQAEGEIVSPSEDEKRVSPFRDEHVIPLLFEGKMANAEKDIVAVAPSLEDECGGTLCEVPHSHDVRISPLREKSEVISQIHDENVTVASDAVDVSQVFLGESVTTEEEEIVSLLRVESISPLRAEKMLPSQEESVSVMSEENILWDEGSSSSSEREVSPSLDDCVSTTREESLSSFTDERMSALQDKESLHDKDSPSRVEGASALSDEASSVREKSALPAEEAQWLIEEDQISTSSSPPRDTSLSP